MSDPLDLEAIEARAEKATREPWEIKGDGRQAYARFGMVANCGVQWADDDDEDGLDADSVRSVANAEFIAAARTDVPALVAEVRRLTADLAECYRLTGADPDGDSDAHLARHAVDAVRRLRAESDHEGEKSEEWERCYRALETGIGEMLQSFDGTDVGLQARTMDALRSLLAKGGGS